MGRISVSSCRKTRLNQIRYIHELYRKLVHRNLLALSAHQCRRRAPTAKFLRGRKKFGMFRTQVQHLLSQGTDEDLKKFVGLKFDELHTLFNGIKDKIAPKKRSNSLALSAKEKLMITLSYLRGGWSLNYATTQWLVSRWTLAVVIRQVCDAICHYVKTNQDFFPETTSEWERIAEGFAKKWQLPHCCGAVDGKHIRIRKFHNAGSVNWCYKKFNSIILLAFVDHNYRIIHFNVGAPGIRSDGGVFKEDRLGQMIHDGTINLPDPAPLPKDPEGDPVNYFFAGDAAFGVGPHMVSPYSGDNLTEDQIYTNYRISRARMVVECAFGHLNSRFGVIQQLTTRKELAILIVRTCCYLHNFLRTTRQDDQEELRAIRFRARKLKFGQHEGIEPEGESLLTGKELREKLRNYFVTKDYLGRLSGH